MFRRPIASRRADALAFTLTLAALLVAAGCGTQDDVALAQVSADATEKVRQGQTEPVAKADRLPPRNQQSQGRPY